MLGRFLPLCLFLLAGCVEQPHELVLHECEQIWQSKNDRTHVLEVVDEDLFTDVLDGALRYEEVKLHAAEFDLVARSQLVLNPHRDVEDTIFTYAGVGSLFSFYSGSKVIPMCTVVRSKVALSRLSLDTKYLELAHKHGLENDVEAFVITTSDSDNFLMFVASNGALKEFYYYSGPLD